LAEVWKKDALIQLEYFLRVHTGSICVYVRVCVNRSRGNVTRSLHKHDSCSAKIYRRSDAAKSSYGTPCLLPSSPLHHIMDIGGGPRGGRTRAWEASSLPATV